MSLTSPNCPAAQDLPIMVENAVASVPGVKESKVAVVWDPPWDPSRMSDEARTRAQYVVRASAPDLHSGIARPHIEASEIVLLFQSVMVRN